jgi:nucleotide-binding universal stress UspA family protein
MYQRILVPVDGSSFSEEVLPYARGIVEATGARLELVRVAERDSEHDEASRHVQAIAERLQVQAKTVRSRGPVAAAILEEAARQPKTLVAITSRGRSGLVSTVLGSVARDLIRSSHAPVLVYRPAGHAAAAQEPARYTTVMLPLDGSELSEGMQAQAGEWARALKARLLVVQVISPDSKPDQLIPPGDTLEPSYVRARAVGLAAQYGVEASWEVLHGDPVDAMSSFLDGRRDVLVVMATHGRTALQSAVLGSVARGLVHRGGVPIVVRMPPVAG